MNRLVAFKAINPASSTSRAPAAGLTRRSAPRHLYDPCIVTVFQTDLDGPFPSWRWSTFPASTSSPGRKVGPLPVTDAVYYIRQAAEGLQHAFEQGLVHATSNHRT